MNKALASLVFVAFGAPAMAQMSPVGLWKSLDDKTHAPKSEVRITDNGGVLTGKVERVLREGADPHAVCDKCADDRKGKPLWWAWRSSVVPRRQKARTCGKRARSSTRKRQNLHPAPDTGGRRQQAGSTWLDWPIWRAPKPGCACSKKPITPPGKSKICLGDGARSRRLYQRTTRRSNDVSRVVLAV